MSINDSIVIMRRSNLENLPPVQLPNGYELRVFRPGDESAWEQVIGNAFKREDRLSYFDSHMRQDPDYFDPNSIFIIWKENQPVATACAWLRSAYGPEVGYLHKVAVISSERGKGLGHQASLACLHKMVEDGRKSAVLRTQVKRIPAIKIYLNLGFEPWILEDEQDRNWEKVWKLIESGVRL